MPPQPFMILRYATNKSESRSAEAGSLRASKVISSSRPANNACIAVNLRQRIRFDRSTKRLLCYQLAESLNGERLWYQWEVSAEQDTQIAHRYDIALVNQSCTYFGSK